MSSADLLLNKAWTENHEPTGLVLRDLGPGEDEGNLDKRLRGALQRPDILPQLEHDSQGNTLLRVTPGSIQAELMVEANALAMQRNIAALEKGKLLDGEGANLQAEVKTLEGLNARLRGHKPYGAKISASQEKSQPNQGESPKSGLRQRIGQTILRFSSSGLSPQPLKPSETYTTPEGVATGNVFTNADATALLHNLLTATGELRSQVQHGTADNPETARTNEIALAKADAMISLRTATVEQMYSPPLPQPPVA